VRAWLHRRLLRRGRDLAALSGAELGQLLGTSQRGRRVPSGDQVPPGATVDRTNKRITSQSADVHLKVLGSPEGSPEMTFLIAGLSNPSITVPRGAKVEVEFINGDPDTSHAWELVRGRDVSPTCR
jgi:hypothetical protein